MRKQRRGGETNGWKAAAESEEGKRTDGSPLLVGGTAGRRNSRLNSLRVKRESRLDLLTPESPIRMRRRTCVRPCGEGTSRRPAVARRPCVDAAVRLRRLGGSVDADEG